MFVIIEDGKVVTIGVDNTVFPQAIEAPDDTVFGDTYADGTFKRTGYRPEPIVLSPAEQRKTEYATRRCIAWENDTLTIDGANLLYSAYLAEGDTIKAGAIQALIIEQKTAIRAEIPDSAL